MSEKLFQIGEFGLIKELTKQLSPSSRASKNVILGPGDDTAVLPYKSDRHMLYTTDMICEGVHFSRDADARDIGHKALASNISDIAAMGGLPKYAVVSLAVPNQLDAKYVQEIYKGMRVLAKKYGVEIVGGDTVANDRIIINVALIGEVKKAHFITRHKAKKGDYIFVTGPLGGSFSSGNHLKFIPRIDVAQELVKKYKLNTMIDISDGLVADLGHIIQASKVGAMIYEDLIPKNKFATLKQALYDGEDFELLFTVPKALGKRLAKKKGKGTKLYHIGEITPTKDKIFLIDSYGNKEKLTIRGFEHF